MSQPEEIPPTNSTQPPKSHPLKSILTILTIIIAAVAVYYGTTLCKIQDPNLSSQIQTSEFIRTFTGIQESFPSESEHTFFTIRALVGYSLKPTQPRQPAAIVVLIPPNLEATPFPSCFVRKLAVAINNAYGNGAKIKEWNSNTFSTAKSVQDLHEDLKSYFDGGGRAVIVEQVHKLIEPSHVLVFHAFCDNSQAYEKRAVYFFLLPVPPNVFNKYELNTENSRNIANDVLNEAWANVLEEAKRAAVIGRIVGSVVVLNGGDACTN